MQRQFQVFGAVSPLIFSLYSHDGTLPWGVDEPLWMYARSTCAKLQSKPSIYWFPFSLKRNIVTIVYFFFKSHWTSRNTREFVFSVLFLCWYGNGTAHFRNRWLSTHQVFFLKKRSFDRNVYAAPAPSHTTLAIVCFSPFVMVLFLRFACYEGIIEQRRAVSCVTETQPWKQFQVA